MPAGFHPCFHSQEWFGNLTCTLTFQSDGRIYHYSAVPQNIWDLYNDGSLDGDTFNSGVRATIGPYTEL